ncbi:MAG: acyl carrier protein [Spirochaetes bacterium]|nr:acyl carrier protein [Spirochaetota bacterium]
MEKTEVREKVKKVIAHILHIEEMEVPDEANFIFDLGADSQQSLELVAGFQEEFNIEMDEDKALTIQTVSDAVAFIEKNISGIRGADHA